MSQKAISDTVTVSVIANVEVDPDEFDLRVRKPEKIERELLRAATDEITTQEVLGNSDESLERYRRKIKEARDNS